MQAPINPPASRLTASRHGPCSIAEVIPLVLSRYGLPKAPSQDDEACIESKRVLLPAKKEERVLTRQSTARTKSLGLAMNPAG
jgi:hypothetical protein